MRINLPFTALFAVSFAGMLWLSGGVPAAARAPVQQPAVPAVVLVHQVPQPIAREMQTMPALLVEQPPATLSELTVDDDPETRAEAQALTALLQQEAADL